MSFEIGKVYNDENAKPWVLVQISNDTLADMRELESLGYRKNRDEITLPKYERSRFPYLFLYIDGEYFDVFNADGDYGGSLGRKISKNAGAKHVPSKLSDIIFRNMKNQKIPVEQKMAKEVKDETAPVAEAAVTKGPKIGEIYHIPGGRGFYWVCVEERKGPNFESGLEKITKSDGQIPPERMSNPFLFAIVDIDGNDLRFHDYIGHDLINVHKHTLVLASDDWKKKNKNKIEIPDIVSKMVYDSLHPKKFMIRKGSTEIRCFQEGQVVLYRRENDKRTEITNVNLDEWVELDINFSKYLEITGFKELSKKDELNELRDRLLSENCLGCQKSAISGNMKIFLDLIEFLSTEGGYKRDMIYTFAEVSKILAEPQKDHQPNGHATTAVKVLKQYIERLKAKY